MSLFRDPPVTQYVDTGDGYVGYQVFGRGANDVVFFSPPDANVEAVWGQTAAVRYFDRLSSFSRVAYFNPRGSGVSDPIPSGVSPTFDYWADDARNVMDAAGLERAGVIGDAEGGPMAMLFAATYPDRVSALVLVNSYARLLRSPDYPIGMPEEVARKVIDMVRATWGTNDFYQATLPGAADDPVTLSWLAHYQKLSGSPKAYGSAFEQYINVDVRSALPAIAVPTLVITRNDAAYHRAAFGSYVAARISNARLVELPGADTSPFFFADPDPVLDEIEEFLTGVRVSPVAERTLATVMFTDIVNSTGHAARLGDDQWLKLLDDHGRLTRQHLESFRGKEISDMGDGFVATFDGPTRAVACAAHLAQAVADLGLEIRAGLHTGEIEPRGDNIGGLAVHIASRVTDALPEPGVVVSRTVTDLVIGSGIEFEPVGSHTLKGVPGEWDLYRVAAVS